MLIEKFFVPGYELIELGLQAIDMSRLGHSQFVVLAGKNGAGKSRILNKLIEYIGQRNGYTGDPENIDRNIQTYKNDINNNPPDHERQVGWKQELERISKQRTIAKERLLSK